MSVNKAHPWEEIKQIKTPDIRKLIPKTCYQRSFAKTFFWLILDLAVFFIGMFLVFFPDFFLFKLIGSLIAGLGITMLFGWAHDAAHGALFKSTKISEILGTLAMLPSLNIYRMWSYGHNKVHHGFNSFSPIDWIWRPLTLEQYKALSPFQRFLYRVERNFFTCAFHYLRRIWWAEMLHFNPGKNTKQRWYFRMGKLFVLLYLILLSTLAYFFAGGLLGVLLVVVLPFIVFNYFISMIVYLHHTHPEIPFFKQKKEWGHTVGALYCSTVVHCSKVSSVLLHYIMTHIPHHLDIRIPFYHLPQAYQAIKKDYGHYFHEYRFKWSYVRCIFKQCKLYDFEKKAWMSFEEAEKKSVFDSGL